MGKKQLNPELATFMSSSYNSMNIRIWTSKNSLSALKNINMNPGAGEGGNWI